MFNFGFRMGRALGIPLPPSFPDDPTNPSTLLTFHEGPLQTDTTAKDSVGDTVMPNGYNYRACCYESVASDSLTVSGLLTTDTVEVPAGSSVPVLSNDTITFSTGLKYWEITIKRAGIVIAFFACGEGSGDYAINSIKDGVVRNGEITTPDTSAFHSKLTDGTGYDHNVNGLAISDGASYYYDDSQVLLIPDGVYIAPVYESISLSSAYLADGSSAPLTYKPNTKLALKLVKGPCLEVTIADSFTPSESVTVVSTLGTAVLSSDGTKVTTAGTLYKIVLSTGAILDCAEVNGAFLYSDQYETDNIKFEITTPDLVAIRDGVQDEYFAHTEKGYGKRENGVYWSEDLTQSPWSTFGNIVREQSEDVLINGHEVSKITFLADPLDHHRVYQSMPSVIGSYSFAFKAIEGSTPLITVRSQDAASGTFAFMLEIDLSSNSSVFITASGIANFSSNVTDGEGYKIITFSYDITASERDVDSLGILHAPLVEGEYIYVSEFQSGAGDYIKTEETLFTGDEFLPFLDDSGTGILSGGSFSVQYPPAKVLINADKLANLAGGGPHLFDVDGNPNTFTIDEILNGGVFNENSQYYACLNEGIWTYDAKNSSSNDVKVKDWSSCWTKSYLVAPDGSKLVAPSGAYLVKVTAV